MAKLSELAKQVMAVLADGQPHTNSEIAVAVGRPSNVTAEILNALVARGRVRRSNWRHEPKAARAYWLP